MPDQAHHPDRSPIRDVQSYIGLPLIYNHWYVAGFDDEFGEMPKAKTLLERSIVFYRTKAGELTALQNRCLHRSFPLADGTLNGDNLVCGYHGMEYDPDGRIVRIPCQDRVPNRKLKKYPLRKQGPYIFIWMGDEDAVDESKLPDFGFLGDPQYESVHEEKYVEGSYLLMMENLNDLTHFSFLHANSFAFGEYFGRLETEAGKDEEGVYCYRLDRDWKRQTERLPPALQEKLKGKEVLNRNGGVNAGPGLFKGFSPLYVYGADGEVEMELKTYVMHFVTPETKTTAHYWWSLCRDYGLGNDEAKAATKALFSRAFDEDLWAIRNMQALLEQDHADYEELIIAGDQAGMLFRREVLEWVKAEYPEFR